MNVMSLIRKKYPDLRASEKRVAEYVLAHSLEVMYMPMRMLAERCYTSDTTIIRFYKSLGYPAYRDFKRALANGFPSFPPSPTHSEISEADDFDTIKIQFANLIEDDINNTLSILDMDTIDRAVDALIGANSIEIYGWARSGYVAHILGIHLLALGRKNSIITDQFTQERSTTLLKEGDVAVGISYTGRTDWVVRALKQAKERGATTICITNFTDSPIVEFADIPLFTAARKSLLGPDAGTSRLTQLALIDFLALMISFRMRRGRI